MGQVAFGYPSSIIGTTLGQPAFLEYMGLVTATGLSKNANGLIGATSGVFQVCHMPYKCSRLMILQAGAFFETLLRSFVMDNWGRRGGVVYCASLSILGGVLLCASQNIGMFIAFRFFARAGSWGFLALSMVPHLVMNRCSSPLAPVYTAELAPAELRGFFVGMNGVMIAIGYSLASYMGIVFMLLENITLTLSRPGFLLLKKSFDTTERTPWYCISLAYINARLYTLCTGITSVASHER
jgi:hypothetical protein